MPNPGFEHGEVQVNVAFAIKTFLKQNPLGRVATESGTVTERKPDTVRGPDVSYYSKERLPLDKRVVGYHDEVPDLCVEIVSPSNSTKQLKAKAKEYLFAGVRLVWIIDPEERTATVITEPLESRTLEADAILDGGDVLHGFSCKVSDLFA
jgi:Uma2 family endonuclease